MELLFWQEYTIVKTPRRNKSCLIKLQLTTVLAKAGNSIPSARLTGDEIELKVDDWQLAESCLSSPNNCPMMLQPLKHGFRLPSFCKYFC